VEQAIVGMSASGKARPALRSQEGDIVLLRHRERLSAVVRGAKAEPKQSNLPARTDFRIASAQELLAMTGD